MGKAYTLVIYLLPYKDVKIITPFILCTLGTEYQVAKFYRSMIELSSIYTNNTN